MADEQNATATGTDGAATAPTTADAAVAGAANDAGATDQNAADGDTPAEVTDIDEMFDLSDEFDGEAEFGAGDTPAQQAEGSEQPGEADGEAAGEGEGVPTTQPTPDPAADPNAQTPEAQEAGTEGQEPQPGDQAQQQPDANSWDSLTPEEQAQKLADFNAEAVNLLAEQVYGVSEEDVTAFQEDPGKMLPQFAGRLHMQIMQAATMNVMRLLPQVLANYQSQNDAGEQLQQAFYGTNTDLNHEEHGDRVLQFGQMYRQMNPNASDEELIRDVGAWVRTSLGKPPLGQQPAASAAQPVAQQPATPPYTPAAAGAQGQPLQGGSGNEFEEIFSTEFDE